VKKAIITGIFGQDGSYLFELLNGKGYEIHGIVRNSFSSNSKLIKNYLLSKNLNPINHNCDLYNYDDVENTIKDVSPHEVYHLAATHYSSEQSTEKKDQSLFERNLLATFNILTALKKYKPEAKVVLAGSCLMFDGSGTKYQDTNTPFNSHSFYGLGKICENQLAVFFRNQGMHVSMAILYNHESPRRSPNFVTKKIVKEFVEIYKGERDKIELGNLNAVKDWGYAKDYVNGMWMMAQYKNATDFILATGKANKIIDFVEAVAAELDIGNWKQFIYKNPNLIKRKIDTTFVGNTTKAKNLLGWNHSINFKQLVKIMVNSEMENTLD